MKRLGPGQAWTLDRPVRGFSLLELVVVVVLTALLIYLAMDRLLPLRGQAEAAMVQRNEGLLRAGLGMEVATRVLRQGMGDLPELEGGNPMDWMAQPAPGYLGVQAAVDPEQLPPGAWSFDAGRGVLVYRVRYTQYFDGQPDDPPRVEWRVELHYAQNSAPAAENIRGVLLQRLGTPSWTLQTPEAPN
jgi:hypothetical protein